jgi:hypothetical protein
MIFNQRPDEVPTALTSCSLWRPALAALLFMLHVPALTLADGGTLRLSRRCEAYLVSLLTSPSLLSVGNADFSVLIQDAQSQTPLSDVPVNIFVYPVGKPEQRIGGLATTEAATNKLFRAITLPLSEEGRWKVEVLIDTSGRSSRLDTEVEVVPATLRGAAFGMWIAWPLLPIALFAFHQVLVWRSKRLAD